MKAVVLSLRQNFSFFPVTFIHKPKYTISRYSIISLTVFFIGDGIKFLCLGTFRPASSKTSYVRLLELNLEVSSYFLNYLGNKVKNNLVLAVVYYLKSCAILAYLVNHVLLKHYIHYLKLFRKYICTYLHSIQRKNM